MSDDAKDIVRRMLQKNPNLRPSAITLLKQEWFTKLEVFEEKQTLDHQISQKG